MDIYQIWTTYNRQWSKYEILAFVGVLILACTAITIFQNCYEIIYYVKTRLNEDIKIGYYSVFEKCKEK